MKLKSIEKKRVAMVSRGDWSTAAFQSLTHYEEGFERGFHSAAMNS